MVLVSYTKSKQTVQTAVFRMCRIISQSFYYDRATIYNISPECNVKHAFSSLKSNSKKLNVSFLILQMTKSNIFSVGWWDRIPLK